MATKPKYYMVYGGEVVDVSSREFKNPDEIEVVGIYPDHDTAVAAWRGAAQRTVDNAQMRYFVVQIDHLQDVSEDPGASS